MLINTTVIVAAAADDNMQYSTALTNFVVAGNQRLA